MKLSLFSLTSLLSLLPIPISLAVGPSYFYITNPVKDVQWTQGSPHSITWIHAQDSIVIVDVELARMSDPGILFAAREVPTRWGKVNMQLDNVPPGNDYYMIFLNVTHGVVYSISDTFTILPSSTTTGGDTATNPGYPTITVSGPPHPQSTFTTTFGVDASKAVSIFGLVNDSRNAWVLALVGTWLGVVAGGAWAIL